MNLELDGDDVSFDEPSPSTASPPPSSAAAVNGSNARRRKGLPVHRCRFPDWSPAGVSALAITPESFDAGLLGFGGNSGERGVLAVGRANGDVELMLWGGHQGWVSWRTLPSSFPLPKQRNSRRPTSLLSHLVWTHQTTLSSNDLDLYEGDVEGAEHEVRRLQREGVRLFGVGGVGSELVEWEWGGPGSGRAVGMVKSTLPTLPPIFAVAASRSSSALAIACEDSTIRILNILDGELELVSKIEVGGPGKVRALSLAWGPPIELVSKGKERESSPSGSSLPMHFVTPSESHIVAGCSNSTIRRFDVPTSGSVVGVWRGSLRMTLDRLKGEHTVVWAVSILEDGTVVSGDSMGNVKFWDGKMGTQTQSFRAHKADVLALALGSDGTSIFTSGVDQKTVEFRLVTVASSRVHGVPAGRWIQASGRRLHSHDVRAIVISPPYSFPLPSSAPSAQSKRTIVPVMTSGGLDLSLILTAVSPASSTSATSKKRAALPNPVSDVPSTEFESTVHRRAAYVPQRGRPFVVAAGTGTPDAPRLLVCRRDRGVGIWRLDDPKRAGSTFGLGANAAPLRKARWGRKKFALGLGGEEDEEEEVGTTGYEKVAELELRLQTNLVASAVSHDGKWLAVSDLYETKLFRMSWRGGELVPRRQKSFNDALVAGLSNSSLGTGSSCLTFTKDSQRLVLSSAFGSAVAVVELPQGKDEEFEVVSVFGEGGGSAGKTKANGLPNGSAKADEDVVMNGASDTDDSDTEKEDSAAPTKRVPSAIVCVAVSGDNKFLATAESDRTVRIFDLTAQKLYTTLPTPPIVPSWLSFAPSTSTEPTLIIPLPSNALLFFGLTSLRFHPWGLPLSSRKYNALMDIREPVLGIAFEPRRTDAAEALAKGDDDQQHIHPSRRAAVRSAATANTESSVAVVWGANWVAKIDIEALRRGGDAKVEVKGQAKRKNKKGVPERREMDRKRAREEDDDLVGATAATEDESKPIDIRVTRRYQPLVLFDFVGLGELVAVERTWFDVARELPEAWVKSGQFGT
ncbi:U3 small nucleolar RNA-associated protein 4 [Rhodotorula toruloides]|uniref:U3 small nucleolar RNA-associated protein 4 n=1 Tax=Rhodotorula toruloides TaxID=5286 RepID=A0A511KFI1_RHOTO|nr:U3 small nucleolar RNA-associated protein 4 [Rhodotorula toruloides]